MVLKTNVGGMWVVPQVESLRARGHDVTVVLPPGPGRLTRALRERDVAIAESPFGFSFRPAPSTVTGLWRLRRLLRELRPDAVLYHLYASALATRITTLGLPAARVHMIAGPLFLESPLIRSVERHLWRLDDLTVCGTAATSRLYQEIGCPPAQRTVITYGVDTDHFDPAGPPTTRRAARAELGLRADAFVAILVAFVYPPRGLVHRGRGIKGHDVLLTAWDTFAARHPEAQLLLVGGGWGPAGQAHRAELIARFGIDHRTDVVWLDSTTDVRLPYTAADVSVSPSLSEGHGAAVEAGSMGLPSIVSDAGGLPETVDSDTGWVVPRGDPGPLVDALEAAHAEFTAGTLAARGHRVRRRTVELFDSRRAADRLAANIERTAAQRAGTPFTTTPGGTSRVTQAPAPTVASAPTVSPCNTAAVVPISTPSPIRQVPDTAASGPTVT